MDNKRLFCCPAKEITKWKNCAWHGKPGSCDDDHCDVGHQVQLATDAYGEGQSCAPRFERQRVYCCDPAQDGTALFPPVPLDRLFEKPPSGSTVDTEFELKVDSTWGTGSAQTSDTDPNDASFAFVILTSPEELQISLDKRDSPWEIYGCQDTVSEEEQTVRMICSDQSENDSSGCGKIYLGHGAPGTILEMPKGCGPGKYAVAKSLTPAADQTRPKHLVKRFPHMPTVYELTFDYRFARVPRDPKIGQTQMRIDFSNEAGYWDQVVEAAAGTKKVKRSLDDYGRNHKRWLDDEWRDDVHHNGLSKDDLHKRWFGSDVLAWLKKLVSTGVNPSHTHNLEQTFTAILVREEFTCPIGDVEVRANLLAQAQARVQVSTTFGLTIITTLSLPLDLSKSFMYFSNKGKVEAIFTIDALASVKYSSKDKVRHKYPNLSGFANSAIGIIHPADSWSRILCSWYCESWPSIEPRGSTRSTSYICRPSGVQGRACLMECAPDLPRPGR
jgi:chitinase